MAIYVDQRLGSPLELSLFYEHQKNDEKFKFATIIAKNGSIVIPLADLSSGKDEKCFFTVTRNDEDVESSFIQHITDPNFQWLNIEATGGAFSKVKVCLYTTQGPCAKSGIPVRRDLAKYKITNGPIAIPFCDLPLEDPNLAILVEGFQGKKRVAVEGDSLKRLVDPNMPWRPMQFDFWVASIPSDENNH